MGWDVSWVFQADARTWINLYKGEWSQQAARAARVGRGIWLVLHPESQGQKGLKEALVSNREATRVRPEDDCGIDDRTSV